MYSGASRAERLTNQWEWQKLMVIFHPGSCDIPPGFPSGSMCPSPQLLEIFCCSRFIDMSPSLLKNILPPIGCLLAVTGWGKDWKTQFPCLNLGHFWRAIPVSELPIGSEETLAIKPQCRSVSPSVQSYFPHFLTGVSLESILQIQFFISESISRHPNVKWTVYIKRGQATEAKRQSCQCRGSCKPRSSLCVCQHERDSVTCRTSQRWVTLHLVINCDEGQWLECFHSFYGTVIT